ncbi:MAG: AAA family ATPase, partial [Defluviitaleaceae bacterium]|nr:AAA family ATPase [Defluviitaleaceae bacterium]
MIFTSMAIKNFRNFEDISVDLRNKNVFFGMNDIGKTNLLCAIRYLFDRDMRRNDLVDSDYFKRRITTPIEITATIDIGDKHIDTDKLRAKLKGNIGSGDTTVFIKLTAEYDEQESRGDIILKWGCDENKLVEMKSTSGGFVDLDLIFQVYYINSYIDLNNLFKKNISTLVKKDKAHIDEDRVAESAIEKKVEEINAEISKLSGVKSFEGKLTPSYKKMREENISISIKSDFAISSLYSNIVPYIHKDGETGEYPTQGEGRKKLVAYSVYNILAENTADKKINLFLIEEPET